LILGSVSGRISLTFDLTIISGRISLTLDFYQETRNGYSMEKWDGNRETLITVWWE
jgi:hypothetical protein